MKKRVLSMLLAVLMVFTMMPTVFAEDSAVKAKIGDTDYESVSSALDAAYNAGMTDVVITLVGETNSGTTDSIDLYNKYGNGSAFNTITIRQADASKPYYLQTLYTGWTQGKVVFDGVNIVVTTQLYAIGKVELTNNSTITRSSDITNFVFYGDMVIEPGSKLVSLVDRVNSGSSLTIDGGRTDSKYNSTTDYKTVWLYIDGANDSMTIKNGAYVVVSNWEYAEMYVNGTVDIQDSRLDVFTAIRIGDTGVLKVNAGSQINTKAITGTGKIIIDPTGMNENEIEELKTSFINKGFSADKIHLMYTITYDMNGGEVQGSNPNQYITNSGEFTLNNPTKTGYTFTGWSGTGIDGKTTELVIDTTETTGNLNYTANWQINQYTITFENTGDTVINPITQDYGSAVTAPVDPTKTGYTFKGWDATIPSTMPAGDMTITAKWDINQYTITFADTGDSAIAPFTQDYNSAVTAPADPTKTGYTFNGWDKTIPTTMPAENMTITAQWTINKYTVSFVDTDGTVFNTQTGDYGTAVTVPENPTKTGYTFLGWDKEIPATIPVDGVEINALWQINSYTVSFDSNGGSEVAPQTVEYGSTATQPENPSRSGYRFRGWYTDDTFTTPFDFTTPITESIELVAKWKRKDNDSSSNTIKVDKEVEEVKDLIDEIGKVTLDSEEAIEDAREAYDDLSAAQKQEVGNFEDLLAAEEILEELIAEEEIAENWPFIDVTEENEEYEAVKFVYVNDLMVGTGDGTTFEPEAKLSRAMTARIFYALENEPEAFKNGNFSDVARDFWYTDSIDWAADKGVISGDGNGHFFPNMDVTREQLAVMLYQYAQGKGYEIDLGPALDQPDRGIVSSWAAEAMQWAINNGILVENGVGYLAATDAATRADVAEAFMAFVNLYV